MKKVELMNLLGKKLKVIFKNGDISEGVLCFVDHFSYYHDYRKPGYFYLKGDPLNYSFKVSHIKKVVCVD